MLVVMGLGIIKKWRRRGMEDQPKIRWSRTFVTASDIGNKLIVKKAWWSRGDTDSM